MKRYKSVDEYISNAPKWQEELVLLREIMLTSDAEEAVKWGAPAYLCDGKTIIGLGGFKDFVTIWFHQGALLKDPHNKLVNAQEGVTKALRQYRFTTLEQIQADAPIIKAYVAEAIENQLQGREIKPAKQKPLIIPEELKRALDTDSTLNSNFEAFNLTKKREFAEYISEAKREETRLKRLDKIRPMIAEGIGLNDKYRKS